MITETKMEDAARLKAFRILSCDTLEDPERTLMDAFEDGIDWYKETCGIRFAKSRNGVRKSFTRTLAESTEQRMAMRVGTILLLRWR